MSNEVAKNQARLLLEAQVDFPAQDSNGHVSEGRRPLGDVIDEDFIDLKDDETPGMAEGFRQFRGELRTLARTGRADREALGRAVETLGAMIAQSKGLETVMREMLSPGSDTRDFLAGALAEAGLNFNRAADSDDYYMYLHWRCTTDILERLRGGLVEINHALGRGPSQQRL